MPRQLAAWELRGKWYLSAFMGARTHANGKTPAKEFDSREELEQYARASLRRSEVVFEYEGEIPEVPLLPAPGVIDG